MDVAADGDGGVDSLHVALLDQNLSGFGTQVFDLLLADYFSLLELFNLFV
jgi:hypothetical protein